MPVPPSLPPEVWSRILTHLPDPSAFRTASLTSHWFHSQITAPHFDYVWRRIWDESSTISSHRFALKSPWALVAGDWRQQVAASYRIETLSSATSHESLVSFVPPRYNTDGNILQDDMLNVRIDVENVLGRATDAVAYGKSVLIAFERGIALLRRRKSIPVSKQQPTRLRHRNLSFQPTHKFWYDDAPQLHGIAMFSDTPIAKEGYVIAITHTNAIAISLTDNPLTPVRWRVIDQYEDQIRSVVHVSTSDDARYALVGSSDGFVRVIDIKRGGCRFNLCLPECAEHIVANSKWVVAGNAFHPLTLNVWQLSDGACVDNYTASSMGWQSVLSIAGLTTTRHQDHFAIWNGRDCVRILDVKSGNFIRAIPVCCRFAKGMRSATEEAEHGAGAPLTGRKRMILLADGKTAAVATSNRVMIVSLDASQRLCTKQIQLDGARRALIEKSTDDRVVVTAESNAFGGLGTRVSGTASIASKSRLQVWKTDTGALSSEMTLPSPATSISVCGDIVAVVCGAVGQVMVVFAKRQ